jgi:hypothetical protein
VGIDLLEDLGDLSSRFGSGHAVEARCIAQVLHRRHLLEEGRLHGNSIDQTANRTRLGEDVETEDPRGPPIREEQRGQETDERRLAGTVLAEDGHALATSDGEGDALEGRGSSSPTQPSPTTITPEEPLGEV